MARCVKHRLRYFFSRIVSRAERVESQSLENLHASSLAFLLLCLFFCCLYQKEHQAQQ